MAADGDLTLPVVWVDTEPKARRASLLRQAIEESRPPHSGQTGDKVIVKLCECDSTSKTRILSLAQANPSLIFIVVSEAELAAFGTDLQRIPCASVRLGYELISECSTCNDIYFVIPSGRATGVDVLSLLVSGARGVVGLDALCSSQIVRALVNRYGKGQRLEDPIVAGEPMELLDHLIELVDARYKRQAKFELLLALSEIPLARLPIQGSPTNTQLAEEIGKFGNKTGYYRNTNTERIIPLIVDEVEQLLESPVGSMITEELPHQLRLRLGYLGRVKMIDPPYLPMYARLVYGLPSCLLPVRDTRRPEQPRVLYDTLTKIRPNTHLLDDIPFCRIRMPEPSARIRSHR